VCADLKSSVNPFVILAKYATAAINDAEKRKGCGDVYLLNLTDPGLVTLLRCSWRTIRTNIKMWIFAFVMPRAKKFFPQVAQ
jgi:hypothetical protein